MEHVYIHLTSGRLSMAVCVCVWLNEGKSIELYQSDLEFSKPKSALRIDKRLAIAVLNACNVMLLTFLIIYTCYNTLQTELDRNT